MITQNALLLDMMDDANKLVSNLTKLSYAPGLPEPYLVPEGITVDVEKASSDVRRPRKPCTACRGIEVLPHCF